MRANTTVSVDGQDWELDQGFLAGRVVTVGRSILDGMPWVEHEAKRLPLDPVDPKANPHRKRPPRRPGAPDKARVTPFDPPWRAPRPRQRPPPRREGER